MMLGKKGQRLLGAQNNKKKKVGEGESWGGFASDAIVEPAQVFWGEGGPFGS